MVDFYYQLRQKMIESMQNSLRQVRQILGLGVQEFSDIVGLTRQSINNLESKKSRMSATQYIAICAVIDYYTKDKPEQYEAILTILSSNVPVGNSTLFPSIKKGSLLKKWFLCFPDDSKNTEFYGSGKTVTPELFGGIAYSHKIFMDDSILCQKGFDEWISQVSDIMLENDNRFLVPVKVVESIQSGIISAEPLTVERSQRGMRILMGMQKSGLIEIRGEKSDSSIMSTLLSVFARFKNANRLAILTQNEKLARQIQTLNNDALGGFPIYVARFEEGAGLQEWDATEERDTAEALKGWESIES